MLQCLPEYKKLVERYDAAENALFGAVSAQTLSDCGLAFKPKDYGLSSRKRKDVQDKVDRAQRGIAHLAGRMLQFETEAGDRLSCALQLLQLDAVIKRIPNGETLRTETLRLLPEALFITRLTAELQPVRVLYRRLLVLWGTTRQNEDRTELIGKILQSMEFLHDKLQDISRRLSKRMYPFDHADEKMTLRGYLLPEVPEKENLPGLIFVTQDLAESLMGLQVRLFARLAVAAENVETALGLPPLPQPKPDEPDSKAA
jgi:hypothetical protein